MKTTKRLCFIPWLGFILCFIIVKQKLKKFEIFDVRAAIIWSLYSISVILLFTVGMLFGVLPILIFRIHAGSFLGIILLILGISLGTFLSALLTIKYIGKVEKTIQEHAISDK